MPECTPAALAELAACFVGLSPKQQSAAQIFLLCTAANNAPVEGQEFIAQSEFGNAMAMTVVSTTGFFAVTTSAAVTTIYPNGGFVSGATTSITVFPCVSAVDSTKAGSITFIDGQATEGFGVLDLTELTSLTFLDVNANSFSSVLVSGLTLLISINVGFNSLNSAAVDAVLIALNGNGSIGGTCDTVGNVAPGVAGLAAKASLILKGWTVTTD